MMKNKFGVNLKHLREDKKLTQKRLAEKLFITQRKISYWENEKAEPDMDTLLLIAEFFDVSVGSLLGAEDI